MGNIALWILIVLYSIHITYAQGVVSPSIGLRMDSSSLDQCLSASFEFTSNLAVPPFFMLSFAHGGESTIDYLGTDPLDLEWTVRHNVKSKLFYYAIDSEGNISDIYNGFVRSTGSTNCQIPSAPQDFQLLPSTFQVSGCDTMKLNVVGGTEPYTMVIVGENDVTNFTIPNSNTTLNYVNVQETGSIFLVTASDANGQWAESRVINSIGSSSDNCLRDSSTSITTQSPGSSPLDNSTGIGECTATNGPSSLSPTNSPSGFPTTNNSDYSSNKGENTVAIAAISSSFGVFILLAGIFICYRLRRRRIKRVIRTGVGALLPFKTHGSTDADISAYPIKLPKALVRERGEFPGTLETNSNNPTIPRFRGEASSSQPRPCSVVTENGSKRDDRSLFVGKSLESPPDYMSQFNKRQ